MFIVLAVVLYTLLSCLAGVVLGALIKAGFIRRFSPDRIRARKVGADHTFFASHSTTLSR